jgi:hypothetical protein
MLIVIQAAQAFFLPATTPLRFNGIPAAVKLGAVGSWEEEALAHEASMYKALHHLQVIMERPTLYMLM